MREKNIVDIFEYKESSKKELEKFSKQKEMEVELINGEILKYPFSVNKIIDMFEKKLEQRIRQSPKIYIEDNWEYKPLGENEKMEFIDQLQTLYAYKYFELKIEFAIEYNMRKPQTFAENKKFKEVIEKTIRNIFGKDIEENMAQILTNMFIKDLEIVLGEEDNYMGFEVYE